MTGHGMATGTGLYDPNTLAWDPASIRLAGHLRAEQLPTIGLDAFPLRAAFRRRYPALREARWWPALGDGAAGNLGSGATGPGRAAINVGTSAAFRVMRRGSRAEARSDCSATGWTASVSWSGGAVSNAGNLRAWCRRELNLPAGDKALEIALAARPEPLRSLVVLPFWSAERAPTWCEDVGGVVTGLSQDTTALDLLQATTEAVYQRLALIADLSVGKVESVRARGEPGGRAEDHRLGRHPEIFQPPPADGRRAGPAAVPMRRTRGFLARGGRVRGGAGGHGRGECRRHEDIGSATASRPATGSPRSTPRSVGGRQRDLEKLMGSAP